MTVTRNFGSFVTDPNITFLNDKNFFQKWEYHFLVKSTKNLRGTSFIINHTNHTDQTKASVKKNKLWSTNLTYHKERCFTTNGLIFSKIIRA